MTGVQCQFQPWYSHCRACAERLGELCVALDRMEALHRVVHDCRLPVWMQIDAALEALRIAQQELGQAELRNIIVRRIPGLRRLDEVWPDAMDWSSQDGTS